MAPFFESKTVVRLATSQESCLEEAKVVRVSVRVVPRGIVRLCVRISRVSQSQLSAVSLGEVVSSVSAVTSMRRSGASSGTSLRT